jgi:hypothetical protein
MPNDSPPCKEQIMPDITLESVVRRSSDIMASQVENELVMMDVERGMYYALNTIGADIWERLAQPVKVADLCAQLQQRYAVDHATCEADVLAILRDMSGEGLLQQA